MRCLWEEPHHLSTRLGGPDMTTSKYYVAPSDTPEKNIVDNAYYDDMMEAVELMIQMQADFPEIIWAVFEAEVKVVERLPILSMS